MTPLCKQYYKLKPFNPSATASPCHLPLTQEEALRRKDTREDLRETTFEEHSASINPSNITPLSKRRLLFRTAGMKEDYNMSSHLYTRKGLGAYRKCKNLKTNCTMLTKNSECTERIQERTLDVRPTTKKRAFLLCFRFLHDDFAHAIIF